MLAPKPPRSVVNNKPVAVQVVKQEKSGAVNKHVLIVENKPAGAEIRDAGIIRRPAG